LFYYIFSKKAGDAHFFTKYIIKFGCRWQQILLDVLVEKTKHPQNASRHN
jgi:hypothetical protein